MDYVLRPTHGLRRRAIETPTILYGRLLITSDGARYVYRCRRVLSELYLATELR